jgi:hypothetical protein
MPTLDFRVHKQLSRSSRLRGECFSILLVNRPAGYQLFVDEEGRIIAHASQKKDAVRAGIFAGTGAVIGGLAGGK